MLHETDKDHYWHSVEMALDILEVPRDAALEFRARLERVGGAAEELFYHAEPLDVAKDLAGIDACTSEQVAMYVEKISSRLIG